MNIYIGNFSSDVTEDDLRQAFEKFGQVADVKLIKDKYSGESRGFGFIEMPSKKEAEEAMNGTKELKGRMVVVNEARPRSSDSRGAGRQGSGHRGGYSREGRY
ncbi:MAG: RNA-binding protein [Candidatus Omnitrophota bacterium]